MKCRGRWQSPGSYGDHADDRAIVAEGCENLGLGGTGLVQGDFVHGPRSFSTKRPECGVGHQYYAGKQKEVRLSGRMPGSLNDDSGTEICAVGVHDLKEP